MFFSCSCRASKNIQVDNWKFLQRELLSDLHPELEAHLKMGESVENMFLEGLQVCSISVVLFRWVYGCFRK